MHRRMLLALPLLLSACDPKGAGKQVGPLKDWVVGVWVRTDDRTAWEFKADGEMATSGALPILGTWVAEEPNKVQVRISGGAAITASMQLGIKQRQDETLVINFSVKDDEMKPEGLNSSVIFRKR